MVVFKFIPEAKKVLFCIPFRAGISILLGLAILLEIPANLLFVFFIKDFDKLPKCIVSYMYVVGFLFITIEMLSVCCMCTFPSRITSEFLMVFSFLRIVCLIVAIATLGKHLKLYVIIGYVLLMLLWSYVCFLANSLYPKICRKPNNECSYNVEGRVEDGFDSLNRKKPERIENFRASNPVVYSCASLMTSIENASFFWMDKGAKPRNVRNYRSLKREKAELLKNGNKICLTPKMGSPDYISESGTSRECAIVNILDQSANSSAPNSKRDKAIKFIKSFEKIKDDKVGQAIKCKKLVKCVKCSKRISWLYWLSGKHNKFRSFSKSGKRGYTQNLGVQCKKSKLDNFCGHEVPRVVAEVYESCASTSEEFFKARTSPSKKSCSCSSHRPPVRCPKPQPEICRKTPKVKPKASKEKCLKPPKLKSPKLSKVKCPKLRKVKSPKPSKEKCPKLSKEKCPKPSKEKCPKPSKEKCPKPSKEKCPKPAKPARPPKSQSPKNICPKPPKDKCPKPAKVKLPKPYKDKYPKTIKDKCGKPIVERRENSSASSSSTSSSSKSSQCSKCSKNSRSSSSSSSSKKCAKTPKPPKLPKPAKPAKPKKCKKNKSSSSSSNTSKICPPTTKESKVRFSESSSSTSTCSSCKAVKSKAKQICKEVKTSAPKLEYSSKKKKRAVKHRLICIGPVNDSKQKVNVQLKIQIDEPDCEPQLECGGECQPKPKCIDASNIECECDSPKHSQVCKTTKTRPEKKHSPPKVSSKSCSCSSMPDLSSKKVQKEIQCDCSLPTTKKKTSQKGCDTKAEVGVQKQSNECKCDKPDLCPPSGIKISNKKEKGNSNSCTCIICLGDCKPPTCQMSNKCTSADIKKKYHTDTECECDIPSTPPKGKLSPKTSPTKLVLAKSSCGCRSLTPGTKLGSKTGGPCLDVKPSKTKSSKSQKSNKSSKTDPCSKPPSAPSSKANKCIIKKVKSAKCKIKKIKSMCKIKKVKSSKKDECETGMGFQIKPKKSRNITNMGIQCGMGSMCGIIAPCLMDKQCGKDADPGVSVQCVQSITNCRDRLTSTKTHENLKRDYSDVQSSHCNRTSLDEVALHEGIDLTTLCSHDRSRERLCYAVLDKEDGKNVRRDIGSRVRSEVQDLKNAVMGDWSTKEALVKPDPELCTLQKENPTLIKPHGFPTTYFTSKILWRKKDKPLINAMHGLHLVSWAPRDEEPKRNPKPDGSEEQSKNKKNPT